MSKKRKASAQLTISDLFSKKRKDVEDEGECALTPTSSLSADSIITINESVHIDEVGLNEMYIVDMCCGTPQLK